MTDPPGLLTLDLMSPVVRIVVLAGLLLAGCTDTDSRERSPSSSPPRTYDMPIALVTHLSREATGLTERQARDVLAGRVDDWSALGDDAGALRIITASVTEASEFLPTATDPTAAVDAVVTDPGALAIVPASAVTPQVRAMTVGEVSPFHAPDDYPLTTQVLAPPGAVLTTSIVGDIMLGRRVGEWLARADDPADVLRPMARRLAAADVTVGNLESTLSKSGAPTQGGDSFGADPDMLAGLRLAGFDVLSVANNHLGDYGERAIGETVAELRDGGFRAVGGGTNLARARQPAIVERKGVRIGFIATDSIGETPAASSDSPGTNRVNAPPRTGPLDRRALARVAADIRALDARVDLVVVLPHWGTQYTHTPEPVQRTVGRRLVDAGADLVVGGHPHWVQGLEVHDGVVIAHSLGNFVFDMDFMTETQQGVVLEATYWDDELKSLDLVPYRMDGSFAPRPASPDEGAEVLSDVWSSSTGPFRGR